MQKSLSKIRYLVRQILKWFTPRDICRVDHEPSLITFTLDEIHLGYSPIPPYYDPSILRFFVHFVPILFNFLHTLLHEINVLFVRGR